MTTIESYPSSFYSDKGGARLQAEGNLTLLEFVAVVKRIWEESHPDIPVVTLAADHSAHYPCIAWWLVNKRTMKQEPKARLREQKKVLNGRVYQVHGQRFQNLIAFSVYTDNKPDLANVIIEEFESFMIKYIPLFKRLGASELVYAQRLPDDDESRAGKDATRRTVTFWMTTELLYQIPFDRIEAVEIDIRMWLKDNGMSTLEDLFPEGATPVVNIVDLHQLATPT